MASNAEVVNQNQTKGGYGIISEKSGKTWFASLGYSAEDIDKINGLIVKNIFELKGIEKLVDARRLGGLLATPESILAKKAQGFIKDGGAYMANIAYGETGVEGQARLTHIYSGDHIENDSPYIRMNEISVGAHAENRNIGIMLMKGNKAYFSEAHPQDRSVISKPIEISPSIAPASKTGETLPIHFNNRLQESPVLISVKVEMSEDGKVVFNEYPIIIETLRANDFRVNKMYEAIAPEKTEAIKRPDGELGVMVNEQDKVWFVPFHPERGISGPVTEITDLSDRATNKTGLEMGGLKSQLKKGPMLTHVELKCSDDGRAVLTNPKNRIIGLTMAPDDEILKNVMDAVRIENASRSKDGELGVLLTEKNKLWFVPMDPDKRKPSGPAQQIVGARTSALEKIRTTHVKGLKDMAKDPMLLMVNLERQEKGQAVIKNIPLKPYTMMKNDRRTNAAITAVQTRGPINNEQATLIERQKYMLAAITQSRERM